MNVLLIENDSETRAQIKAVLKIRGHQVAEFEDCRSGLEACRTQKFPLVLVTGSLPGMDGAALCRKIRNTHGGHDTYTLAMVDHTSLHKFEQMLEAGIDDHLSKPVDLQLLSIRIAIAEKRINTQLQQTAHINALHENLRLWNCALENSGYGVWDWNLQTGKMVVSKAGKAILGFADNEMGDTLAEWSALVNPEDKPHLKETLRTFFRNKAEKYSIEYRVRCRDKSWKWLLIHGVVANRTSTGGVSHIIGTHTDITERKNFEREFQFAAFVYQAIGEAVMITDDRNHIIAVNQAFTKLSGYTPNEVIGKNMSFMHSGRHNQAFFQAMWHKLDTTGIWEGAIWSRRKNGEEYAAWQLIHTVHSENGKALKRVALYSDVTDQKLTEENIRRQAYYDPLTGLPNRLLFQDRLGLEIKKSNRANLPVALLFIDLDQFKEVNDALGHDMGDTLLQEAACRIGTCVRESDTLARLGGDEFTVILPELPDPRHIDDIAQKIIFKLAEPYNLGGKIVHVSASIGISLYPNDANSISELMKNADQAMYVAKNNGRNRFSHFATSLQQQVSSNRISLIDGLRDALVSGQFKVYFQPIVELSTGRINKAEALLRWQHPTHGIVSPMEFIPLAEDTGLIDEIGDWVFKESARYAKQWSKRFTEDFQVSINMSPVQFRVAHEIFAAEWLRYLQTLALPGKNMVVEITEKLLLNTDPDIKKKLFVLRDAGIQVAIDDFGTDYSSLSHHKNFGIDFLKIDQPFVLKFATDQNDLALSEVVVMAHQLGLKVIAEGVETEAQRHLLTAAGCDYAQGDLYSKPILPEVLDQLLANCFDGNSVAPDTSTHVLLTENETAAFLQPHMPHKSVKEWLTKDRQHDPIIPFVIIQGQYYYLESDSEKFVTRTLNPSARFVRIRNRLYPERRNMSDRRRMADRIATDASVLQHGIKRRRMNDAGTHADAQHQNGLDRRAQSGQTLH